jgi:hypothetical protein
VVRVELVGLSVECRLVRCALRFEPGALAAAVRSFFCVSNLLFWPSDCFFGTQPIAPSSNGGAIMLPSVSHWQSC